MIHLRETEVLEGKMSEPFNGVIGGEFAPAHLVEKIANGFGIHGSAQHSAFSIQPGSSQDYQEFRELRSERGYEMVRESTRFKRPVSTSSDFSCSPEQGQIVPF